MQKFYPLFMSSSEEGHGPSEEKEIQRTDPTIPSEKEKRRWKEEFRPLFPALNQETFSDEILAKVFITPSSLPHFHERLLSSLLKAPNVGSRDQLYTVSSLYLIFSADSLYTSTGSLDYALSQKFISRAITDPDALRGEAALLALFQAMEEKPDRSILNDLFLRFDYGQGLSLPQEITPLLKIWDSHTFEDKQSLNDY